MFELTGIRVNGGSSYLGFELSGVFLWESISEGSRGMQKQFESLEVWVIVSSSYQDYAVL